MRGTFVTLLVGLLAVGAVAGAGWAVQAAALPPPARADRVAANAASWLLRYRLTWASFVVDGQRERGYCVHTWFRRRNGVLARGSLLALDNGLRILDNGGPMRTEFARQPIPQHLAMLQLELAACPAVLGSRVAAAAQTGAGVHVEHAYTDGIPALELKLPAVHLPQGHRRFIVDRATIWVSARTYKPLAVKASIAGYGGIATVRLAHLTPALFATLVGPIVGRPGIRP